MVKLESLQGSEWIAHSHPPIFAVRQTSGGQDRVDATVPAGDTLVMRTLMRCLTPPYLLLYVLHTPRGEGEPGRYQSPELSWADADGFLKRFGDFLTADARFDLWVHSPDGPGTIVWDRHNLIYAYGEIPRFVAGLRGLGFDSGEPAIPVPHAHNYHPAFDGDARAVLAAFDWNLSPLRPEDEQ